MLHHGGYCSSESLITALHKAQLSHNKRRIMDIGLKRSLSFWLSILMHSIHCWFCGMYILCVANIECYCYCHSATHAWAQAIETISSSCPLPWFEGQGTRALISRSQNQMGGNIITFNYTGSEAWAGRAGLKEYSIWIGLARRQTCHGVCYTAVDV